MQPTAITNLPIIPRGIRNNNPGNIERSATRWRGKINPSQDARFEQFETMEYGIRAAFILIRTYYHKHKLQSVEAIINRYAPSIENNTRAYINVLARNINVLPGQRLNWNLQTISALLFFIFRHENGQDAVTLNEVQRVVQKNW